MMRKGGYLVKRSFAFALDWYLSSLLFNIISGLITLGLTGQFLLLRPDQYVTKNLELVLIISALLSSFLYYVYYPFKHDGQTLMFKVVKLRIVKNNMPIQLLDYLKRFYLGCFILQSIIYSSSSFVVQMILFILFKGENSQIDNLIFTIYFLIILFNLFFIFKDSNSRALHDFLFKTKVIDIQDYQQPLKTL